MLKKKAATILLSVLTLVVLIFPGCAPDQGATRAYSIPKNGIVTKAQLEKLRENAGLAIFKGSEKGIDYEWTFVGPEIRNPTDVNLKVDFHPSNEAAMRQQADTNQIFAFSPAQEGVLPGKPSLSITVGKSWAYGTYKLYASNAGVTAAGQVQVVNGVASLQFERNNGGWYFFTKSNIASAASSSGSSTTVSSGSSGTAPSGSSATTSSGNSGTSKTGSANPGGPKGSSIPPSQTQNGGENGSTTGGTNPATPAPTPNPPALNPARKISVTMMIRCDTAVKNWNNLKPNKQDHHVVPADGCILPVTTESVDAGETVYDLLVSVCEHNRIQMQHKGYAIYNSEYIQGINNLYEFDCGQLSGWMYCVNGWYPNYGCSQYVLKNGDAVQWNYTCNLGRDLPGGSSGAG